MLRKTRAHFFILATVISCLSLALADNETRNHKKRQIYREQVLPHAGGKIPQSAFETDRLFLNHLQKEGISVPDGVVLERRNPQVYPFYQKPSRTVFRVVLSSDGRYTPVEGKYEHRNNQLPSVETTYLYPQVHGNIINVIPTAPIYPIYKQLQLHNPQLNQVKYQPKKKAHFINVASKSPKSYKTESYQNVHIYNVPIVPVATYARSNVVAGGQHFVPNLDTVQLFREFDELFNRFELHDKQTPFYDNNAHVYNTNPIATYTNK